MLQRSSVVEGMYLNDILLDTDAEVSCSTGTRTQGAAWRDCHNLLLSWCYSSLTSFLTLTWRLEEFQYQ